MVCASCGESYQESALKRKKYICANCGHHFRIPAMARIEMVADKGSFRELDGDLGPRNVFHDESYSEKLSQAQEATGLTEAVVTGEATVLGEPVALAVCDSNFMMGSMGYAVGEKVTRLVELATEKGLPAFLFCCSGGARMQEGILSLMQMEKTAAAIRRHDKAGLFLCTVLTDPTTGGVTASFAMLGDVIMAEPGATIGFAGKRVIKQTIGEELPEGFQTSEFMVEHGMSDGIVQRKRLRQMMQFLCIANRRQGGYANFRMELRKQFLPFVKEYGKGLFRPEKSAWEKVRDNRGDKRPSTLMYIRRIFDVFVELKGDRYYRDDQAVVGGIALLDGQPVTVITEYRGADVSEAVSRNFGMPMPEGYRKALRLMRQAEKFGRPIITFVNTQGAYCGVGAEERGQGVAIARNLAEMSDLKVPILAVIVGEGGSGGALALAVGDEVWMLENATYSILTPEGYASILWKDSSKAPEAAARMHMTAKELKELGVIDRIVPEFGGASKENVDAIADYLKEQIIQFLKKMSGMDVDAMLRERYDRFRKY